MALGSIVLVLVIVAALVIIKVSGGGGSSAGVDSPPAGTPVPAATMSHLATVPLATLKSAPADQVGAPAVIHEKALTVDGKPELLYVGAEWCPVCAAERWAMYVALSKFGTFSPEPGRIHSAVRDGDIPTLTFYKTTYTSPYFTFVPEEIYTNHPDGDTYITLQSLTATQQAIWESNTSQTFPFLDFGGKEDLTTAQYDPSLLEGPSFDAIANDVGNNTTAIGAGIDASADVLVHTICSSLTDHKPAEVCDAT
jgi:thiol-disulfide isomerase/thioredoxin